VEFESGLDEREAVVELVRDMVVGVFYWMVKGERMVTVKALLLKGCGTIGMLWLSMHSYWYPL
jgi:hypothetical protein